MSLPVCEGICFFVFSLPFHSERTDSQDVAKRTQRGPVCPSPAVPREGLCVPHPPSPERACVSLTRRPQTGPVCPSPAVPGQGLCVPHLPSPDRACVSLTRRPRTGPVCPSPAVPREGLCVPHPPSPREGLCVPHPPSPLISSYITRVQGQVQEISSRPMPVYNSVSCHHV